MSTIGAVAEAIAIIGKIIKNHIDDPKKRLEARREAINALRAVEKEMEMLDEKDVTIYINALTKLMSDL